MDFVSSFVWDWELSASSCHPARWQQDHFNYKLPSDFSSQLFMLSWGCGSCCPCMWKLRREIWRQFVIEMILLSSCWMTGKSWQISTWNKTWNKIHPLFIWLFTLRGGWKTLKLTTRSVKEFRDGQATRQLILSQDKIRDLSIPVIAFQVLRNRRR